MTASQPAAGTAFVTGATGFLGRSIVTSLVAAGRPVKALVRSDASARNAVAIGAEPVRGDLRDRASLEAGLTGCAVVYHVAGANAFCLPDPRPLFEVNVSGSRALVLAAAAAGVGRLVYTSSAATLDNGLAPPGQTPGARQRFLSNYARSKYEAERAVLGAASKTGISVICVNPASVQGPGRTSGTARLLLGYLNGRLPAAVDGPLNVVDIADCTRGHLLAEEHGVAGERYLLCGASMTLRQGLALLAGITGIEDAPRFLPAPVALAAAGVLEAVARVRHKPTRFCREMVRTLIEGSAYDGTQATRDLGLVYTPIEDTMRRTIRWYLDQGLITRPLPGFTDAI
jgi:dihydroflavonol-4-reductase